MATQVSKVSNETVGNGHDGVNFVMAPGLMTETDRERIVELAAGKQPVTELGVHAALAGIEVIVEELPLEEIKRRGWL